MQSLSIIILLTVSISIGFAQQTSKAMQYFNRREHVLAVYEFEKELKKSNKLSQYERSLTEGNIGISYYWLNKPVNAANWLRRSIAHGNRTAATYCIYGRSLQKQEKYEEALTAFHECIAVDSNYFEAKAYITSCEYALARADADSPIKLRSSRVNTEGSEYGISNVAGTVFFSRCAAEGSEKDPRTGFGYTEIYSAELVRDDIARPQREKNFTQAHHNTGVFTFDSVENYIYMTVCDPATGHCGIYRSKYGSRKNEKPEPFLVSDRYDMAHPAIARGGSRLYFTSNVPGGYGKTDIWHIDRLPENRWSEPVNAGNRVNTPGRDEFPYVDDDKILYFSSDWHPGFGGLDLFSTVIDSDEPCAITNLGRPFNSGADDFNLITCGNSGFFVSSRNNAKSDDILVFSMEDMPVYTANAAESEQIPNPDTLHTEQVVHTVAHGDLIATLYFELNSYVPQNETNDAYDSAVSLLQINPHIKLVIEGYADGRGNYSLNHELSQKRAQYIHDRLVEHGAASGSLQVRVFGDRNSAVPDASTEEEYRLNRRVVIRVEIN